MTDDAHYACPRSALIWISSCPRIAIATLSVFRVQIGPFSTVRWHGYKPVSPRLTYPC